MGDLGGILGLFMAYLGLLQVFGGVNQLMEDYSLCSSLCLSAFKIKASRNIELVQGENM